MLSCLANPKPVALGSRSATPTICTNGSVAKISMSAVPPRPAPIMATFVAPEVGVFRRARCWGSGLFIGLFLHLLHTIRRNQQRTNVESDGVNEARKLR